ncbi:hypothetical protein MAM1_0012c01244 [Mucor ambiguus]|uniref:F-box domain-containing protein n=1 Tax=Mucor ambiguus TaxID=91626 RepID=A0A0C9M5N0_9FUNG|nr:hypothetical protein MAM1_0012c01244 [Mucor ambiguus]
MVEIALLPEELLSRIFGYIDSNVQLAQCRLVCSKWSYPANTAMFSNTIVFTTKEKLMALHAQLFNDPSRGKLIRHIYFRKDFDTFWMVKTVFNAAPLLNLETFEGEPSTTEFYNTMLDIIKDSPTTFNKLESLPEYKDTVTQAYCDVLRACRHTLSVIKFNNINYSLDGTMMEFALELCTFDRLENLTHWGFFQQISDIELLLRGCIHVKKVNLGARIDGDPIEKQQLEMWMHANVKQVESLTQLDIRCQCRCDVMEYLAYKYPNIQCINIYLYYYDCIFANNMEKFKRNMDRILQAIKGIPNKEMTFWLPKNVNFFETAEFFTQKGYQFTVKRTKSSSCLLVEIEGL